jgi:hypothetical protein
MHDLMQVTRTKHDFDFLFGRWSVRNRRLTRQLAGSEEWEEFAATSVTRPLLDGLGNEDEFRTDHDGGMIGMAFRFFDEGTGQWSIYWADSRRSGLLDPPVIGSFSGGVGVFEGSDVLDGKAIGVRFVWSNTYSSEPRWEQAFSEDGGQTWETNWIMELSRIEDAR